MKIKNPPEAANLIASTRSQGGYTLASALADLFDNSIDHKASMIRVDAIAGDTIQDYKEGDGQLLHKAFTLFDDS